MKDMLILVDLLALFAIFSFLVWNVSKFVISKSDFMHMYKAFIYRKEFKPFLDESHASVRIYTYRAKGIVTYWVCDKVPNMFIMLDDDSWGSFKGDSPNCKDYKAVVTSVYTKTGYKFPYYYMFYRPIFEALQKSNKRYMEEFNKIS